jgi:hypothetical protein
VRYLLEQRVTRPSESPIRYALKLVEDRLTTLGDEQLIRVGDSVDDALVDYRVVLLDEANKFTVPTLMGQPWIFLAAQAGGGSWEMTKNLKRGPASNPASSIDEVLETLVNFREARRLDLEGDSEPEPEPGPGPETAPSHVLEHAEVSVAADPAEQARDDLRRALSLVEQFVTEYSYLVDADEDPLPPEDAAERAAYLHTLEELQRVESPDREVLRTITGWFSRKSVVVGVTAQAIHLQELIKQIGQLLH